MLFCIVAYEKKYFNKSLFYSPTPPGKNAFLHRVNTVAFWFENGA
jgi:hypothetical protein